MSRFSHLAKAALSGSTAAGALSGYHPAVVAFACFAQADFENARKQQVCDYASIAPVWKGVSRDCIPAGMLRRLRKRIRSIPHAKRRRAAVDLDGFAHSAAARRMDKARLEN